MVADLELVLAPIPFIQELDPNTVTIFGVERIKVTEFFRLFKTRAAFKKDKDVLKFSFSEMLTSEFSKFLAVMFLQLGFEISVEISFLTNLHVLVTHILKGFYKPLFQRRFALCRHKI